MADDSPNPQVHFNHPEGYGLDWAATTPEGFEIWICDVCHFLESYCLHKKNSWNEDGTTLTCDACGIDGT